MDAKAPIPEFRGRQVRHCNVTIALCVLAGFLGRGAYILLWLGHLRFRE
jgi:hypothetical protein